MLYVAPHMWVWAQAQTMRTQKSRAYGLGLKPIKIQMGEMKKMLKEVRNVITTEVEAAATTETTKAVEAAATTETIKTETVENEALEFDKLDVISKLNDLYRYRLYKKEPDKNLSDSERARRARVETALAAKSMDFTELFEHIKKQADSKAKEMTVHNLHTLLARIAIADSPYEVWAEYPMYKSFSVSFNRKEGEWSYSPRDVWATIWDVQSWLKSGEIKKGLIVDKESFERLFDLMVREALYQRELKLKKSDKNPVKGNIGQIQKVAQQILDKICLKPKRDDKGKIVRIDNQDVNVYRIDRRHVKWVVAEAAHWVDNSVKIKKTGIDKMRKHFSNMLICVISGRELELEEGK